MADSFLETGHLYPDIEKSFVRSVHVYFPSLTLLSALIIKLGVNTYIFEILLFIACLLFLWFILLIRKASNILSSNKLDQILLFSLFLVFSIIFCHKFLAYARAFKPDTISFCIGLSVLILVDNSD